MKVEIDDLKQIRFFEKFSDGQLKTIANISSVREYKVKDIIFEQYDELSEVFVLM